MIGHLIEMEMDYINTSHPGFIGGNKAVEIALNQQRIAKTPKDLHEWKEPGSDRLPSLGEKQAKARAILARTNVASVTSHEPIAHKTSSGSQERASTSGSAGSGSTWGMSSIFSSSGTRSPVSNNSNEHSPIRSSAEPAQGPLASSLSNIQLREPPATFRANDAQSEQETVEIAVTRLLLKSYYDIVRKNMQDLVPKVIMHFLVNHVIRELHSIFIRKLYRENLFDEML